MAVVVTVDGEHFLLTEGVSVDQAASEVTRAFAKPGGGGAQFTLDGGGTLVVGPGAATVVVREQQPGTVVAGHVAERRIPDRAT